jgi:hypothetical protein
MREYEGWSIGAAIDDGRNHSINQLRPATADEVRDADAALRLIYWLTNGSRWNDVVEAWESLRDARTASPNDLTLIDRSSFALFRALSAFSEQLASVPQEWREDESLDLPSNDFTWESISAGIAQRAYVEATAMVEQVTINDGRGRTERAFLLTDDACIWLGLRNTPRASLDSVVKRFMTAAEKQQRHILRTFYTPASVAILTIRRLAAEVALGRPILFRIGPADDGEQPITIRDL